MDGGGGDRSPSPPSPAAYLPDELVLEILARLPAKSLRRFKSVSRSWRGLISDPANRSRFAQTLSGFFFHPAALEGPPWRFCGLSSPGAADGGGGLSTVETALSFLPSSRGEMELLDSCNGLLLLRCCSPTPPSSPTADWVALPPPSQAPGEFRAWHNTTYAALGFDPAVSPHFLVFQLVEQEDPCYGFVEAVDIYSSGTGRWALHRSRWSGRCSIFFARQTAT
ncbi:F-box protein At5g07610-like [Panicum hallii]|uniref:F-box protein At5g07610-like n=1 Tax=Panicum hallii TaxID=206008 RepID=UPI000DF4CBC3|nr:F-box protein At5g07610-like [Panicum hallii]